MTSDIKRRLKHLEAWMPRVVRPKDLEGEEALAAILVEYDFDPGDVAGDALFEARCQLLDRAMRDKRDGIYEPRP